MWLGVINWPCCYENILETSYRKTTKGILDKLENFVKLFVKAVKAEMSL